MSSPPWSRGPVAPDSAPLPSEAEVVIIGGGPAGLSCAVASAQAGARTVLLESRPEGARGGAGRASGLIVPGLADSAHRLVEVLGQEDCRTLFDMARQSMNCLEDLQVLDRSGVIMAGLSEPESEALEHDLACYQSMGWKADDFVPDEMQSQHSIGPGLVLTQAGSFDPGAALDRLTQQARLYGAQILHGIQAEDIVDTDGGIEIHCAQGRIQADIVIHTCGWSLVKWLPWAREKLYPVRLQHLCLETEELKLELPMMLQYGHSWARPLSSGLLTGGCRWATPHLEVGETDETRLSEPVEQRVMARAEALFEVPSTASISHRWAQIATYTCDGLPFVGALPGSARQVVCTGWNGRPWSMALAAGASVAAGITSEASVALPRCLSSYRMI